MKIGGEYLVSAPVDQTWSLLCDLERLIPGVESMRRDITCCSTPEPSWRPGKIKPPQDPR